MNAEHKMMKQMLIDAADILSRDNKVFWLEAGTLLGFIRDGGFIEWEHDLDIGMWKERDDLAYKQRLSSEFRKLGYKTCFSDSYINISPRRQNGTVWLDINFYHREADTAVTTQIIPKNALAIVCQRLVFAFYDLNNLRVKGQSIRRFFSNSTALVPALLFHLLPLCLREKILPKIAQIQNTRIFINNAIVYPICFLEGFKNIRIFGHDFPVPLNPEVCLEYKYGKDWRKPRRDWDAWTDDKSMRGFTTTVNKMFLEKRCSQAKAHTEMALTKS